MTEGYPAVRPPVPFLPQLLELEQRGGGEEAAVSAEDIMSLVGDKMSGHFEEFVREHGQAGERKSDEAAKGE